MADWGDDAAPSPQVLEEIRRRVRRQSRRMAWTLAAEMAIAVVALAALVRFALRHPDPRDVAAMVGLSLLVLGAAVFSLRLHRGLWRSSTATTEAFLRLSIERCRRRSRSLRAAWALLAGELAVFIPWLWYRLHLASPAPAARDYALAYGFLALLAVAVMSFVLWLGRRTRRELRELERFRDTGEP
jgi:hypothetical protein